MDVVLCGGKLPQYLIEFRVSPGLMNSTKVLLVFSDFQKNFLSSWVPPDSVAQPWKMTTETVAITTNTITINVLDGVFISASGLTQRPRAYKHKIR